MTATRWTRDGESRRRTVAVAYVRAPIPLAGDPAARALLRLELSAQSEAGIGSYRDRCGVEADQLQLPVLPRGPAVDSEVADRSRGHRRLFFSSRRRHTRLQGDWSSDVCSSD